MQMTNVVAYYQTRLHQFSECLTNFSPLIGELIYSSSVLRVTIKVAGTFSKTCVFGVRWTREGEADKRLTASLTSLNILLLYFFQFSEKHPLDSLNTVLSLALLLAFVRARASLVKTRRFICHQVHLHPQDSELLAVRFLLFLSVSMLFSKERLCTQLLASKKQQNKFTRLFFFRLRTRKKKFTRHLMNAVL